MTDAIFLIQEGRLAELTAQPYDSEGLLQGLLAGVLEWAVAEIRG